MAVRQRCHGNGGAIASLAGLRGKLIVAHICLIRFGGLVAIWAAAMPCPMSMPTMPKQVHCDHAENEYDPDPVFPEPVHYLSPEQIIAHNIERRSKRINPVSCIDTGQTPDPASGDTFSAARIFGGAVRSAIMTAMRVHRALDGDLARLDRRPPCERAGGHRRRAEGAGARQSEGRRDQTVAL